MAEEASTGQHAVVTGAGSGVGEAIARGLAARGYALTLSGRRLAALEAVAADLPRAHAVSADVAKEGDMRRLYDEAQQAFGPPDVVVANAGVASSAPFERTELSDFDALWDVNVRGAFLTARLGVAALQTHARSRLIFIASTAGLKGYAYVAPYCASKHAVIGLTRALAREYARKGLTVNALCPGYVETPMLERTVANIVAKTGRSSEEARKSLLADNPQRRFVSPSAIAEQVAWLCTPAADAVNGQALAMDGGESA